MSERVMLSALAMRLRPLLGADCPTYRKLYGMILDGTFPADRDVSGRYFIEERDIPAVVSAIRESIARYRRARASKAVAA